MDRATVAGALAAFLIPGAGLAQVTGTASLSGLELAADKTDIERFRMPDASR